MGQTVSCFRPFERKTSNRRPRVGRTAHGRTQHSLSQNLQEPRTNEGGERVRTSPRTGRYLNRQNAADALELRPEAVENRSLKSSPLQLTASERAAAALKKNGLSNKSPQYEALVGVDTAVLELQAVADRRDAAIINKASTRSPVSRGSVSENSEVQDRGNTSQAHLYNPLPKPIPPTPQKEESHIARIHDEAPEDWQNFTQPTLDSVEGSISDEDGGTIGEYSLEGTTLQLNLPDFEKPCQNEVVAEEKYVEPGVRIIALDTTRLLSVREGIQMFDDQSHMRNVGRSKSEDILDVANISDPYACSPVTSPSCNQTPSLGKD